MAIYNDQHYSKTTKGDDGVNSVFRDLTKWQEQLIFLTRSNTGDFTGTKSVTFNQYL